MPCRLKAARSSFGSMLPLPSTSISLKAFRMLVKPYAPFDRKLRASVSIVSVVRVCCFVSPAYPVLRQAARLSRLVGRHDSPVVLVELEPKRLVDHAAAFAFGGKVLGLACLLEGMGEHFGLSAVHVAAQTSST